MQSETVIFTNSEELVSCRFLFMLIQVFLIDTWKKLEADIVSFGKRYFAPHDKTLH